MLKQLSSKLILRGCVYKVYMLLSCLALGSSDSALIVLKGGQYQVQKYRGTVPRYFFSTGTGTDGTFSKMVPKYRYRGIRYF